MSTLPSSMQCLLKEREEEGYDLVQRPVPEPGPGDVIIKIEKVGICGSDINLWKWNDVAKKIASLPFIPGHEATGVVVKVGSEVTTIKLRQKVAVENHFYCGECVLCLSDRGDICQRMDQYGLGRGTKHGGCCQYSLVPARYCYVLTRSLTPSQAVLLEPMGVAHNAVSQIEVAGVGVLVLGAGPVGLFAIAVSKALGASPIYAVDIVPEKLEIAKKMGATHVIDATKEDVGEAVMRLTDGNGVERIVEASGSAVLLNHSFKWLRKGGQMVLIGIPKGPLHVDDVLQDLIFKSLTLKTVHGRRIFSTWRACEALLASGKVDVTPLISHDMPMSRYADAFSALLSCKACKILLDPHQ
uniref:L-threonine 3-dehydrogenase-like n=1 Tax=Hirondellea gigas TaxID=1518452 RepID=A0A6A7FYD4_9CRUS